MATIAISVISAPGQPFHDPAADEALITAIQTHSQNPVIIHDLEINSPEFAQTCAQTLLNHISEFKTLNSKLTMPHHFIMTGEEKTEHLPGKTHIYHSLPGVTDTDDLLVIRAIFEPGGGHPFHHHPNKEETLYFLSGTAEQWVGEERRVMTPGCSVHIPPGLVHATFNRGTEPIEVLAIITPLTAEGPVVVEVADQEPWKSLAEALHQ